jgi:hypothetical protein
VDLNAVPEWQSGDWATGKFGQKYYARIPPIGPRGYGEQVKFYTQHLADTELEPVVRESLQRRLGWRFEFRDGQVSGVQYA